MSFEVWAEKYRPKSLKDMINQRHVVERLKAFVKAWAHYAPYVEYGTMYMRANPFMRRAIEDTKRIMPTIISRAFRRHFK